MNRNTPVLRVGRRLSTWSRLACGLAVLSALLCVRTAAAQPPGVGGGPAINRPTTSPYLNLLNRRGFGGSSAALNYYRYVRPEQDLRRYSSQLGQQVTGLRQDLVSQGLLPDGSRPLTGTGHATSFLNTGSYFPGSQRGAQTTFRR
jgi:hypothetical protein